MVAVLSGKYVVKFDSSTLLTMIAWKTAGTKLYQQLPADCHTTMCEVEPLREIPANRPIQEDFYETLNAMRKK